jgi:hypothetical protein
MTLKMSAASKDYYNNFIGTAYDDISDIYKHCKDDETEIMKEISVRWRENSLRLATAITAYELQKEIQLDTLKWCYTFIKI